MTRLRRVTGQTFRAMSVHNFRLYVFGQIVSGSGSWMQQIAQAWLVFHLTGSGVALGVTTALQFTPVLLGGAWAGVVADRVDKRRLLVATAAAAGFLALALGILTATGVVQLWMVYVMALLLGCVTALDTPARRSFVTEIVEPGLVSNAVSLNTAAFTASRVVGPALAGAVIATAGLAWCFYANAASFGAVIAAFALMRRNELYPAVPQPRQKGQLREGLRYAWSVPRVRRPLIMTAVIGTLSFNFQVTLLLFARRTFHGDAATFGMLYSLMSIGALVGALVVAHRLRLSQRFVSYGALAFGVSMLLTALAPTLLVAMVLLLAVGAAGIAFLSAAGAISQVEADPAYRGRVAALFAVAFIGSTPIGGPIVGAVSQVFGPRAGLVLGGVAAACTGAWAVWDLRSSRRMRPVAVEAAAAA